MDIDVSLEYAIPRVLRREGAPKHPRLVLRDTPLLWLLMLCAGGGFLSYQQIPAQAGLWCWLTGILLFIGWMAVWISINTHFINPGLEQSRLEWQMSDQKLEQDCREATWFIRQTHVPAQISKQPTGFDVFYQTKEGWVPLHIPFESVLGCQYGEEEILFLNGEYPISWSKSSDDQKIIDTDEVSFQPGTQFRLRGPQFPK